ncbi:MFS transporter [Massilia sp. IC2-477]|uniref:MFS transporter n=1 Tax=Massilia sp. IC2-477 TaxID=2887198 RepID=UPI001D0F70E4|nr:MFS transporter [Massilia sp. IC2-477]MCC2954347.1 MFS transporter [Massilia sp. IC2-477]
MNPASPNLTAAPESSGRAPTGSWTAVASIGIGAFALVTSEFLPVGLLPQIAREFDVTSGVAGLMVTMPGIAAALVAPLTLAFAGTLDRRHVMWALLGLLALSNVLVALASSFGMIVFGRVLLGIAIGGFWTIGGSLGPRLRPGADASKATSIIFSGVSIGTVAGVPVGTLVGDLLGWRMAFAAASVVSLLVVAVLVMALPSLRPAEASNLRGVLQVLRLRKVQVGLIAILLIFIGQFGSYTYVTPYLLEHAAIPASAVSPILFAYGAASFVGNLLAGWASARSVKATLIATAIMMGASILLLPAAGTSIAPVIGLLLVWGVAFGMLPIAIQSWLFSAAPEQLESVSAVFVSSAQASIGAGALVGGLVVDDLGLLGAMWMGAVCTLAAAALVGILGRR